MPNAARCSFASRAGSSRSTSAVAKGSSSGRCSRRFSAISATLRAAPASITSRRLMAIWFSQRITSDARATAIRRRDCASSRFGRVRVRFCRWIRSKVRAHSTAG